MIDVKRAGIIIDGQLELSKAMFCHKTKKKLGNYSKGKREMSSVKRERGEALRMREF